MPSIWLTYIDIKLNTWIGSQSETRPKKLPWSKIIELLRRGTYVLHIWDSMRNFTTRKISRLYHSMAVGSSNQMNIRSVPVLSFLTVWGYINIAVPWEEFNSVCSIAKSALRVIMLLSYGCGVGVPCLNYLPPYAQLIYSQSQQYSANAVSSETKIYLHIDIAITKRSNKKQSLWVNAQHFIDLHWYGIEYVKWVTVIN